MNDIASTRPELEAARNCRAGEVLVLGATPVFNPDNLDFGDAALGVLIDNQAITTWDIAALYEGHGRHVLDFCGSLGSWQYRMGGQHEGDHHLKPLRNEFVLRDLWGRANEITQWTGSDRCKTENQISELRRAAGMDNVVYFKPAYMRSQFESPAQTTSP